MGTEESARDGQEADEHDAKVIIGTAALGVSMKAQLVERGKRNTVTGVQV
jgi:hypothetical protein